MGIVRPALVARGVLGTVPLASHECTARSSLTARAQLAPGLPVGSTRRE